MEIEKIFKNIIIIDFAFLILIAINTMYQPLEITDIKNNLNDGYLTKFDSLSSILGIVLFFLYLITLNLLYKFISFGKQLYLFVVIAGITFNYLNGSVVYTSFSGLLEQIGGIISGAILILLYFSPIKNNFVNK